MKKIFFLLGIILCNISCSNLQQILNQTKGVSASENAAGLKEALSVGIGNAVTALNKQNGYFGNQALKILLPDEAKIIVDNIGLIPGGQNLLNDAILAINRAAEDAATEAKPIFVNAIKTMTIPDATNILFGANNAATTYLKNKTYTNLVSSYSPKIKTSLEKKLVGNISASGAWTTLTSSFNVVANSVVGKAAKLTPVNTDLSQYVTQKALDGLFVTLANEEQKIRKNPGARVNDLLKKVFGQLDKK